MSAQAVPVPEKLIGTHGSITRTRAAAKGVKGGKDGRLRLGPSTGTIHLVVSRSLLRRVLLIANALFKESEHRGWAVVDYSGSGSTDRDGVAIKIRDHAYPLEIVELTEAVPFTENEIDEWRKRRSWLGREETGNPPPQSGSEPPDVFLSTCRTGTGAVASTGRKDQEARLRTSSVRSAGVPAPRACRRARRPSR